MWHLWEYFKIFTEPVLRVLRPIGDFVQAVVNLVLLFVVYFTAVGIVSLVMRFWSKKVFIDLTLDKTQKSYWKAKNLITEKKERYYRMF